MKDLDRDIGTDGPPGVYPSSEVLNSPISRTTCGYNHRVFSPRAEDPAFTLPTDIHLGKISGAHFLWRASLTPPGKSKTLSPLFSRRYIFRGDTGTAPNCAKAREARRGEE